MRPPRWLKIALFLLCLHILLGGVAGVYVAEQALHPPRHVISTTEEQAERRYVAAHGWRMSEASIDSADGLRLNAWRMEPATPNGGAVLLLHGITDNRLGALSYAHMLLRHGYVVLLPDARAHGVSAGEVSTYGLNESDDIRRWLDWLSRQSGVRRLYAMGFSMGAASILQALPQSPELKAAVADSPFASFRDMVYIRIGQHVGHTGPWMGRYVERAVAESALAYARLSYHADFGRLNPDRAIGQSQTPVLLIHGSADGNIPIEESQRIKADNPRVELWEVAGAHHVGSFKSAPEEYERRVLAFFEARP